MNRKLVELVSSIGFYAMVAMTLNAFEVGSREEKSRSARRVIKSNGYFGYQIDRENGKTTKREIRAQSTFNSSLSVRHGRQPGPGLFEP